VTLFDGRGRWYRWDKRDTVDDYLALSVHDVVTHIADPMVAKVYTLTWTRGEKLVASLRLVTVPGSGVILAYNYQGEPVKPYLVRWDVTTPHYGGWRYWWLCPQCGRRCAILYGGRLFLCRQCHGLTYETAQSGDRQATIKSRLLAIRQRLGAHPGPGWPFDSLPEKPPHMHWQTYDRLCREYYNLAKLRELLHMVSVVRLIGLPEDADLLSLAELEQMLQHDWVEYRQDRAHPRPWPTVRAPVDVPDLGDPGELADCAKPERFTLGELATRAGVPFAFAQEAQREGLLRPDAGRTKRAKRYRGKLATWLTKLHTLRAAGLTWDDLRAWTARRFQPGHEQEARWPVGFDPGAAQAAVTP
jgi:hypothetical protein